MKTLASILSATVFCVCFAGSALADDSTNIYGPKVTTVMPQAIIDQTNCIPSTVIIATTGPYQKGTNGQRTAMCPVGYVADGLTSQVAPAQQGIYQGFVYYWITNCCKTIVEYPSTPSS